MPAIWRAAPGLTSTAGSYAAGVVANHLRNHSQPPASTGTADGGSVAGGGPAAPGKPYKLGATGPNVFDCSGFVRYVFGQVGISLPRSSTSQSQAGTAVSRDQLKPGDLVFFKNTWRNNGQIDHVAVYLGDGQIVHAITSGVRTNRLSGYWLDHYASARRSEARPTE